MVVGCTRSYKLILLIALIAICSYFPVPVLSKAATKASKAQASSKSKGNDASSSNSISTVAIPRGKQTKNPWYRILNRGIVQGIAREIKSSFSSDLEALTLQLTKPSDAVIATKVLDNFQALVSSEYEDPEFLFSLFAKLSRKLSEPNIYTKLKVIISLHFLINTIPEAIKGSIVSCIVSLRSEYDSKVGLSFFSSEAIDSFSSRASTVGELEALEQAKVYVNYIFSYLEIVPLLAASDTKSKKKSGEKSAVSTEAIDDMVQLLKDGQSLESLCSRSTLMLSNVCTEYLKHDRAIAMKRLSHIYEDGIADEGRKKKVENILKKLDPKFKPRPSTPPASPSTSTNKKTSTSSTPKSPSQVSSDISPSLPVNTTVVKASNNTKISSISKTNEKIVPEKTPTAAVKSTTQSKPVEKSSISQSKTPSSSTRKLSTEDKSVKVVNTKQGVSISVDLGGSNSSKKMKVSSIKPTKRKTENESKSQRRKSSKKR